MLKSNVENKDGFRYALDANNTCFAGINADWPGSTMDEPGPPAPAPPPASDKVELMQRWLVEHQSGQPPPQPPSGPVFPPVPELQRVPGQRMEGDGGEGAGFGAGI